MSGLTDADLDLIEKWHEKGFRGSPDVTALVAEVRRLRERRERHSVLRQQAEQEAARLRDRVAELEGAIRRHRDAVIDVPAAQKQFVADRELHALLPEEPTP